MKRLLFQIVAILIASGAFAKGTAELVSNPVALEVLQKKCIRLGTSEVLPIKFKTACTVLENNDLIHAMQDEFVRSISNNGEVDFPIIGKGPGEYYYVNEKGLRTDISELYRKQTDEFSFDYIVMASGKRFFGKYDVVIHLQVVDAGPAGIVYSVKVHAWPHSWLTRSSHKIGLTRSFFRKKMKLISWVAREVGSGLCEQEEIRVRLTRETAAPLSADNQAIVPSP
ncbi:hypothetical protein P4B35_13340 [Pontiellaceae bacterium B12227]|nr:hypothetical protein [Pontiellaceae bacterium B12227]